jgi:hypothetical protein
MPHAIIRRENGRRHEVDFGDAPVRVEIYASEETVEIFIEADFDTMSEERRRFALLNVPRHLFSEATAATARRAANPVLNPRTQRCIGPNCATSSFCRNWRLGSLRGAVTEQFVKYAIRTPSLGGCERQTTRLIRGKWFYARLISQIVLRFRPCVLEKRSDLKLEKARDHLRIHAVLDDIRWQQKNVVATEIAKFPFRIRHPILVLDRPEIPFDDLV